MRCALQHPSPAAIPRARAASAPAGLLALQRSAGNRAATAVAQRRAGPGPLVVQRRARPTVRQGSFGPDVSDAQQAVGTVPDGAFGPNTAASVREFQAGHGLEPDAIVGPMTWAAIDGGGGSNGGGGAPPPPAVPVGDAPADKQTAEDDFRIKGLPSDRAEHPDTIFFDFGSSTVPVEEEAKVAALAADGRAVRLDGQSSEEGQGNAALTDARLRDVDQRMAAAGHAGSRVRRNLTSRARGDIDYRHARRVQVLPVDARDTAADCAAGAKIVPSPPGVAAAYESAARLLSGAIVKLSSPSSLAPSERGLVRETFRDDSDPAIAEVAGHMANLRQFVVDSASRIRQPGEPEPARPFVESVDQCDTTCAAGAFAFNTGVDNTSITTFCKGFTEMTSPAPGTGTSVAQSQQHIVIHESAHGTKVIDCQDFAKGTQRAFSLLSRNEALHNADSFTALARNLVEPGAASMAPLHADTGDKAVPAVEEPLAWLDRWLEGADLETSQLYGAMVRLNGQSMAVDAPQFTVTHGLVHQEFPEVGPPPVARKPDREKVAAINDRYDNARRLTGTNTAGLSITSGQTLRFDVTLRTLTVPPGFEGLPLRPRIEALALALFRASLDVSPGREAAYARLAPKLTNRRTPGFAHSAG